MGHKINQVIKGPIDHRRRELPRTHQASRGIKPATPPRSHLHHTRRTPQNPPKHNHAALPAPPSRPSTRFSSPHSSIHNHLSPPHQIHDGARTLPRILLIFHHTTRRSIIARCQKRACGHGRHDEGGQGNFE